ncbi:hypothetical protein KAW48_02090 [candidate division WOR-3 bacterium]|nr:hypothetical protein [candidate division WOR-3 bacterium]
MNLPKGKILLKDAAIQYVHFDKILNHAKKARDGHLTGYMEIDYPQNKEYLFFKEGTPISAAICSETSYVEHPIEGVIEKAKNAHKGTVGIYQIDNPLLDMILSTMKEKPIFSNKKIEDIDVESLLKKLEKLNFMGFFLLVKEGKFAFVRFQDGKPHSIYPTNKNKRKIDSTTLIEFLKKEDSMLISGFKSLTKEKQADPALVELYVKFLNSLTQSFAEVVGKSLVRKTFLPSYENAVHSSEVLKSFSVDDDLIIQYTPFIATSEDITKGFALWVDQFSDAIFVVLGRKTDEIIHDCIKDFRFALKSAGFFEHSKLSRLDI